MVPLKTRVPWLALALAAVLTAPAAAQSRADGQSQPAASARDVLRTFSLEKPVAPAAQVKAVDARAAAFQAPRSHDSLRTTIGVGYVQGADWGTEILANGGIGGTQVQFHTLLTKGRGGLLFEQGAVSVFHPDSRWRAEAGDLFSHLRGASRGARVSWQTASGHRRPALALYAPRPGSTDATTVVSYRDQIHLADQTLLDAEIASDRSFTLRSRLASPRFEVEGFYRSHRKPAARRDGSVSAGVTLWHGIGVNGGLFRSLEEGDRRDWRTISIRVPLARFFDLTLERAHASTPGSSQTTSAVMGSLAAGQLRLFHRHQQGDYDFLRAGFAGSIERQQTQSVASYTAGPRLNVLLQLATQRTDTGQVQHWEEMQTTLRLTSTTTLRAVTAVPDLRNSQRWRAYFRQELPSRFAVQADYGRLSAFQSIPSGTDRSRFKLMLFKTLDIATPARGAVVGGRVVDDAGRGVAGAGVKLGRYTVESDATGAYAFRHVPAGEYELSIDRQMLPADVAWDGRIERLSLTHKSRVVTDLRLAPLNAIHGRVYVDRNGNGRFDPGEAVAGAVLHLADRVTATDQNGAYTFFNLWPGTYVVSLNNQKLPNYLTAASTRELQVTLGDDGPVTGAEFQVVPVVKPVIWAETRR